MTRVLGARHLAQACLTWPAPATAVLALGTEVDVAHAASMIGLAVIGRRWRRAALASAAVASGFAASGGVAARQAARRPPEPPRRGGTLELRDRWADQLARHLLPGMTRLAPGNWRTREGTAGERHSGR